MTKYSISINNTTITTICSDPAGALAAALDAIPDATRAWWSSAKQITVETRSSDLVLPVKSRRAK